MVKIKKKLFIWLKSTAERRHKKYQEVGMIHTKIGNVPPLPLGIFPIIGTCLLI